MLSDFDSDGRRIFSPADGTVVFALINGIILHTFLGHTVETAFDEYNDVLSIKNTFTRVKYGQIYVVLRSRALVSLSGMHYVAVALTCDDSIVITTLESFTYTFKALR